MPSLVGVEAVRIAAEVDGIRCLLVYLPGGTIEIRNRKGECAGGCATPRSRLACVAWPSGCRSSGIRAQARRGVLEQIQLARRP